MSPGDSPVVPDIRHESLKQTIKQLNTELETGFSEYRTQIEGCVKPIAEELLVLKQQLNRQMDICAERSSYLGKLKVLSGYPRVTSTPSDSTDSDTPVPSLVAQCTSLQSQCDAASQRILTEEQTTDALKLMLEKELQAQLVMKQRAGEVEKVLKRIVAQLLHAQRMHHVATNFLALAQNNKTLVQLDLEAEREALSDRMRQKTADKDSLHRAGRKALERLGTAAFTQSEVQQRKTAFFESLDGEFQRHLQAKQKLTQANRDFTAYVSAFKVIAGILRPRGCDLSWDKGMTQEAAGKVSEHFNLLLMQEASLSSKFAQLTWEYREKKTVLRQLKNKFQEVQGCADGKEHTIREEKRAKADGEIADITDRLSLRLYTGLISLLSQIDLTHDRVASQILEAESPDHIPWPTIKAMTKGYRQKHRERVSSSSTHELARRNSFRSKTVVPGKAKLAVLDAQQPRDKEPWSSVIGSFMSPSEVVSIAVEMGIPMNDAVKSALESFFARTEVVRYFVDAPMVREFVRAARTEGPKLELLLEKSHAVLRTGLKDLITHAKEALMSFQQTENRQKQTNEEFFRKRQYKEPQPQVHVHQGRKEKEVLRLRLSKLFCLSTDTSGDQQSSKAPTSDSRRLDTCKRAKTAAPIDEEAAETQHVFDLRAQLKNTREFAVVGKRSEAVKSTGRLRRLQEDPPRTARAKSLLRDFLSTEQKLSSIKDSQRLTFKSQSLRSTPRFPRFSSSRMSPSTAHRHTLSQTFKTALPL